MSDESLPPFTLAVEWDNARDVPASATAFHLEALERELLRCQVRFESPPVVEYLYDPDEVDGDDVRRRVSHYAPKLTSCADVLFTPVAGADYFGLKSAATQLARTDLVLWLDCDVAPQPGWLEALLAPFADPAVVAAAGFTSIALTGSLASKLGAVAWVYHLRSEAAQPVTRNLVYGNNFAVRADWFRAHPWRAPRRGKKGGLPFLREIERSGKRWVRAVDARALHAPHRNTWYYVRRGWLAGADQDWVARQRGDSSPRTRVFAALSYYQADLPRVLTRVVATRREVGLPAWQVPAALALAFTHWTARFAAALLRGLRR